MKWQNFRSETHPVSAVGSGLSSLWLSFLQPSIRKGMFVEAIWTKRARSTTLVKISTRFTPGKYTHQIRLSQNRTTSEQHQSVMKRWIIPQLSFSSVKWKPNLLKCFRVKGCTGQLSFSPVSLHSLQGFPPLLPTPAYSPSRSCDVSDHIHPQQLSIQNISATSCRENGGFLIADTQLCNEAALEDQIFKKGRQKFFLNSFPLKVRLIFQQQTQTNCKPSGFSEAVIPILF